MVKQRYVQNKINRLLEMFPIVAIIGSRQCGKSTLAQKLRPDWAYNDFESPSDYQLISDDPTAFLALHKAHLVIDEVQQYPDLFKVLRGVIDADRNQKGRFILTGSSSPHITKAITESLAGRIATVELWPFELSDMARALEISASTIKDYLDIIHHTFIWRNLPPYTKNSLKKVQKAQKGFFRDQGILHYFLKLADVDQLLLHPVAGFSFKSFATEELIRGLESTMTTNLEFNYYRTNVLRIKNCTSRIHY